MCPRPREELLRGEAAWHTGETEEVHWGAPSSHRMESRLWSGDRDQIMSRFEEHFKDFGFYSKCGGK